MSSSLSRDGERVEAPSNSTQGSLCFTGGGGCGSNDNRSSLVTLRSLEEDSFKESAEKTNDEVGRVKMHGKNLIKLHNNWTYKKREASVCGILPVH